MLSSLRISISLTRTIPRFMKPTIRSAMAASSWPSVNAMPLWLQWVICCLLSSRRAGWPLLGWIEDAGGRQGREERTRRLWC